MSSTQHDRIKGTLTARRLGPPERSGIGRRGAAPKTGQIARRFLQATKKPLVNEKLRTVELSFSSAALVERWFGSEVLSHARGAADLTRLNSGAPLLFNHNADDVLGVVESAQIGADGKGRAVVRLGRDDRGEWALQQIADGILGNVSFAYQADKYEEGTDGEFIATRWSALEISIVTIPADTSVGVGRSHHSKEMNVNQDDTLDRDDTQKISRRDRQHATAAREEERDRIGNLMALGKMHNVDQLAQRWIDEGSSLADARAEVLQRMSSRGVRPVASMPLVSSGGLGLSDNETHKFSLVRAINASISKDWSDAGFERECSRAVAKQRGVDTAGFFVPLEVQQRTPWLEGQVQERAPYQTGTPVQGGNLVQTQLLYDNFIEALRNASQVMDAGALVLSGLTGNVDIPRRSGVTSTYWVAESGAITEAEATFDKVSLRPKTVGALSKLSRQMLLQATPAIEMLTRQDLMMQIGLAVDQAALSGSGIGNQPTGIANTAGIGSVVGGANGATLSMDYIVQLEAALANSNAPFGSRAYIANTKSIATLKKQVASTGAYIWTQTATGQRSGTPSDINGYSIRATNQARNTLTKGSSSGVCSEIFFGSWNELIIGQWGVLEVLVNPYDSTGFTTGDVLVRAMQTMDIGVRHPVSFAVMSDALTP